MRRTLQRNSASRAPGPDVGSETCPGPIELLQRRVAAQGLAPRHALVLVDKDERDRHDREVIELAAA